ncbi:MAG: FkbM family methyltransferase [Saprospiraceae bacterium]|nr:FkbM family methyltransferase [Saprospiraceae bacterium]MDW8482891.1 FkbM family methyltransferase [Saprospiraceae bacterium]
MKYSPHNDLTPHDVFYFWSSTNNNVYMLQHLKRRLIALADYLRYRRSYAQDGEDMVFLSFYEGAKGYKGFYVDVGAHHPVRFSNTMALYQRGWRGINIDPTPGSMLPFRWLRPRDINLEIAIGKNSGKATFFCFNEPALNTFDEETARLHLQNSRYYIKKTIEVTIEPLCAVLQKYLPANQTIDLLTIDVEGLDLQVLQSNDWSKYSPSFVMVEDINFSIENCNLSETYCFLRRCGYELVAVMKRSLLFRKNRASF